MASHPAPEMEISGFDALYGLELTECSAEIARGRVHVRDELRQSGGFVHGGVYAAIADALATHGTAASVGRQGQVAVGLTNQTTCSPDRPRDAARRRHPPASRPHHVGVGGRDRRRRPVSYAWSGGSRWQ